MLFLKKYHFFFLVCVGEEGRVKKHVTSTNEVYIQFYCLQVDGKTNPKIQSIFFEDFPVYCAHFSTNGEEVILGSKHKTFQYYDMIAGKIVSVPRIKGIHVMA